MKVLLGKQNILEFIKSGFNTILEFGNEKFEFNK